MNKNYWSFCLYPLFLSTLSSCTLANCTDQELQEELDHLAIRAIARFKFPKVDLSYEYDETIADQNKPIVEQREKGYYFINTPGPREINVLLAWMKVYWLEYQLSRERNYQNVYADKDVKAFSSANLISKIQIVFNDFVKAAKTTEEDYSRVAANGKPAIGEINE